MRLASQTYLGAHGTPTSPDELVNHRRVRYVTNLHKVPRPRWLEEHPGDALGSVQVDNTEVASDVMASGGGIGVIPRVVAEGVQAWSACSPIRLRTTLATSPLLCMYSMRRRTPNCAPPKRKVSAASRLKR